MKIKAETNKLIDRCYTKGSPDYPSLTVFQRQKFLNELFPLLDRLGVVIRVDNPILEGYSDYPDGLDAFASDIQKETLKAGYELLIEEKND